MESQIKWEFGNSERISEYCYQQWIRFFLWQCEGLFSSITWYPTGHKQKIVRVMQRKRKSIIYNYIFTIKHVNVNMQIVTFSLSCTSIRWLYMITIC